MNAFDVRIHMMRRRKNKRRPFEVRWRVAGRDKSKSFLTRALADSYRAELIRAARQGMEFDPATVVTASGYTHRRHRRDSVRHMSVNNPSGPGMAHCRRPRLHRLSPEDAYLADHFRSSEDTRIAHGRHQQAAGSDLRMAHNQNERYA